jgi:hypothetical protein
MKRMLARLEANSVQSSTTSRADRSRWTFHYLLDNEFEYGIPDLQRFDTPGTSPADQNQLQGSQP